MKRSHSLRRRLIVAMLSVFVLGLAASAVFYYLEVRAAGNDLRQRTLLGQAREFLGGLRVSPAGAVELQLPPDWERAYADPRSGFFYALYDATGHPVATSSNRSESLPLPGPRGSRGKLDLIGTGSDRLAVTSVPAPHGYVLVVGREHADEEALVNSLLEESYEHFVVVLVPVAVVALVLIWLISGWSLRPIERASREAAAAGPMNPKARIAADNVPMEIRPLVDSVNGALERLANAYMAERRLTADAAHQLRTPLSVLDLRLQRARIDGEIHWPTIDRETAQLRRLVNQLMELAHGDAAARGHEVRTVPKPVNLSRIVREAAAAILPIAEDSGREVEVDASGPMIVHGCADDLRGMVGNLLDNALTHGSGKVRVEVRREQDHIVVEVADEGAGVPGDLQDVVFDRFRKGAAASPGAGLGLAIVRQVADAHHARVGFVPGRHCRLRVVFPAHENSENGPASGTQAERVVMAGRSIAGMPTGSASHDQAIVSSAPPRGSD